MNFSIWYTHWAFNVLSFMVFNAVINLETYSIKMSSPVISTSSFIPSDFIPLFSYDFFTFLLLASMFYFLESRDRLSFTSTGKIPAYCFFADLSIFREFVKVSFWLGPLGTRFIIICYIGVVRSSEFIYWS